MKTILGLQSVEEYPELGERVRDFESDLDKGIHLDIKCIKPGMTLDEFISLQRSINLSRYQAGLKKAELLTQKNGHLSDAQFNDLLLYYGDANYWYFYVDLCKVSKFSRKACGNGLAEAFTMADVIPQVALKFFNEPSIRQYIMNEEEKKILEELPDEVIIYRGAKKREVSSKKFGLSWTTSQGVAEFFAFTRKKNGIVLTATIRKNNILAYFNERQEYEVVIDPTNISPSIFLTKPTYRMEEFLAKKDKIYEDDYERDSIHASVDSGILESCLDT